MLSNGTNGGETTDAISDILMAFEDLALDSYMLTVILAATKFLISGYVFLAINISSGTGVIWGISLISLCAAISAFVNYANNNESGLDKIIKIGSTTFSLSSIIMKALKEITHYI